MARKGLRAASVSHGKKLEAGDEPCTPMNPFVAILHVSGSCFSSQSYRTYITAFLYLTI
jgi:hypothetical protein